MRFLWRWAKRGTFVILLLVLGLLSPLVYVETMCRPVMVADAYVPILPQADWRGEARTLMTYPEWHVVHAYDDYAEVIRTGAPHDFGYLRAISGFWSSLCSLSQASGAHGGVDSETKQMVYTIGVSFTAELLAKAAYEETLGRMAVMIRGDVRAALDDLSAKQASDYADFLQQVPWYRWDFTADRAALTAADRGGFRNGERDLALGIEYGTKAAYARVIAAAVANGAPDALRMRVIVAGIGAGDLAGFGDVQVIAARPEGIEIDTPRYRAFTDLAKALAAKGARFVEIAGNDDIMFTTISNEATRADALHSFARQGNPGYRHLVMVKVADLAAALLADPGVEHIHDY